MKSVCSLAFALAITALIPARAANPHEGHPTTATQGYPLRGVVTQVLPEKKLVLIKHEEIPGFMKAMTMAFRVPEEIFSHLTPGTPVAAILLPRQADGWHLATVRILAQAGAPLTAGVPYRLTLTQAEGLGFTAAYTFTPTATGDWRVCVSTRAARVDLVPPGGQPAASKACTHANPEGFAKGPLYELTANLPYELRLPKAPSAELDVLIVPFQP